MINKFIKIQVIILFLFIHTKLNAAFENLILLRVDNKIITTFDMENEIKLNLLLNNIAATKENVLALKGKATDTLIRKRLLEIEIEKFKVEKYNVEDVIKYVDKIADNLNVTVSELKKKFKNNKISFTNYRNDVINEYKWNTLIYSIYSDQLEINPYEIQNELDRQANNSKNLIFYKLSEIEIPIRINLENSDIKNVLDTIKKNGFEFAVAKFSISASASTQGDLGWIESTKLNSNILNQIKNIKIGEVSKAIKSSESIVFLKIYDTKIEKNNVVENTSEEKIKDMIINSKKNEKLNLYSRNHFVNLKNNSVIESQ